MGRTVDTRIGKRAARPRIDPSHLVKHTEHLRDWIAAVRELVWNAVDAKATVITLRYLKRTGGLDFVVIDDGEAMEQDGLDAMVSLDFSPSAADPDKRGRMGNGSKGFVHHACALRVETRRADESRINVIEYTPGQLLAMWGAGQVDWDMVEPASNHLIRVSGTVVTMVGLGSGEGVNPKHDRSAKRLVDELAGRLPLHVARRVTVIDERGRSMRLKSRKLMGEKIQGNGRIDGLGSVSYELGVVPDPDAQLDRLEVWALEPVCDIHAFLAGIRPTPAIATLLRPVRQTLDHPQVVGMWVCPGLNGLVGQDRLGFRQDLFDDEDLIYRIVRFFHDEILPKVAAILGRDTMKRLTSTDDETMRLDLVRLLQDVGAAPRSRSPIVDVDLLRVSPSTLELEPGDQVSLEIVSPKEGAAYTWDNSKSGGGLDRTHGIRTTFTAGGSLGVYALTVSDGTHKITITVNIVQELPFGFSQRVRHVMPHQRITLRLVNTRHTSGRFLWDGSECGGTLTIAEDTLSAVYEAGETEAEFSVIVTEDAPATGQPPRSTKCFLSVRRHQVEGGEKRMPSESAFLHPDKDGQLYELRIVAFVSAEVAGVTSYFNEGIQDRAHIITVNSGHASYNGQPSAVQTMVALKEIALRIAMHELKSELSLGTAGALEKLNVRAGTILATIISRRKAGKRAE